MYPGQVQPGPSAPYGQAQAPMYGEIEGMYGYSTMQTQQASVPGAQSRPEARLM
jgi:hypothetical protein